MVRNFFPGNWRYRPFFLSYLHYVWMWVWRGEVPSAPLIFVRPLFNVFMKGHFQRRLQRLRREIQLHDGLSDATRSALVSRLNAAIEEWKVPRFTAAIFALPAVISVLDGFAKLMEWLDIRVSVSTLALLGSDSMSRVDLTTYGGAIISYLVGIPVTAFIVKRGIFLNGDSGRVYYPGEENGPGNYAIERDILGKVGLHMREVPFDLWLAGITFGFFNVIQIALLDEIVSSYGIPNDSGQITVFFVVFFATILIFLTLFCVAGIRRSRIGRA
jgi:hypothetical protein